MKEKTLYNISLITFLIGLFTILIITEKIDISDSAISSLNNSLEGKKVKVKGYTTRVTQLENFLILNLKDQTGEITVVAFPGKNITITKDSILEVEGELTIYKNKTEIEASQIKIF
jgi:DNA/RNA endonuclease YhcR with UshA esterase domain